MARRKDPKLDCGTLVAFLLIGVCWQVIISVGAFVTQFVGGSTDGVNFFVGLTLVLLLILLLLGVSRRTPSSCGQCGNPIDRVSHSVTMGGRAWVLCPHCYSQAKRERSRRAWRRDRLR